MMEKEQVRPLAPATARVHSNNDDEETVLKKTIRRKKYIKWCGCLVVVIILLGVAVLTLALTIFKIDEPEIKMNGVIVDNVNLINGTIPRPGSNISLIADISVKNPNYASFRYKNTTTNLYYHDTVVGMARGPPGQSKARRTARMNITIDIIVNRLLENPNLQNDLGTGLLTLSSFTRVGGRVKFINLIKKHVTVKMNCTMKVNITSRAIEDQKCKRKVKL
uniref:late embryogenesis abundant protein At1g64065 n=1 Tax=Erigeron canadensis TaxID=72917 RepID=UPI001CB9D397|nr:late embryogenesis abundant protein At1g64065 [Erigeron canadensis]